MTAPAPLTPEQEALIERERQRMDAPGYRGTMESPPDGLITPTNEPADGRLTEQEKAANRRRWWGLTDPANEPAALTDEELAAMEARLADPDLATAPWTTGTHPHRRAPPHRRPACRERRGGAAEGEGQGGAGGVDGAGL